MREKLFGLALVAGLGAMFLASSGTVSSHGNIVQDPPEASRSDEGDRDRNGERGGGRDDARVRRGFEIAPVPLEFRRSRRELVGLGSYIVNAQAVCADCHSCPTYAPGGNPYDGEPTQLNTESYLAGGVPFGPFTSRNLTPDENGRPAGLTFDEFLSVMRTGHEPDETELLQVMPWPIYKNMVTNDLRAIYEFLRAIPRAQPGQCAGPGEAAP